MSYNRRLAVQDQPESTFTFTSLNQEFAKETIAKYPEGREASAIIPLLWRAHEQNGNWLSRAAIEYVAAMIDMPYIRALEVATFYTMFQLKPVGAKAHIQVCGTTPCMLRGSGDLIKICKSKIHDEAFHLSGDGAFSWEEVECAGACVNAPMVQIGKDTYEDLDASSFQALLDGFSKGTPPKPGPQNGRHFSEPQGGATTLIQDNHATAPRNSGEELTDAQAKKLTQEVSDREAPASPATLKKAEANNAQKGEA